MTPTAFHVRVFAAALAITCLATSIAFQAVDRPLTGIDDANIFLKYAKNISQGDGFVYNAGGERVEGFTSLLWVLVCSAVSFMTAAPTWILLGINVVLTSGVVTGLAHALSRFAKNDNIRTYGLALAASAAWLFLHPKFVIWSTITLMDIGLWSCVFLFGSLSFASHAESPSRVSCLRLSALIALMLLTRPEGMLICLVWGAANVAARVCHGREDTYWNTLKRATWDLRWPLITYVVVLGMLTAFRLLYFGYPLPNTFYAKVSPDRLYNIKLGLGYLWDFTKSQPVIALSMLGIVAGCLSGLIALVGKHRRVDADERKAQTSICLVAGVALIIPVLTGGDHFALARFYQPFWPLMLLPVMSLAGRHARVKTAWCLSLLIGVSGVSYFLQSPRYDQIDAEIGVEFDYARGGQLLGETLNGILPQDPPASLGVLTAGGVAYRYEGPVIDLLGLNNVAMGHSPGDRRGNKNHAAFHLQTFFELKPDLVNPRLVRQPKEQPRSLLDLVPDAGSFWDTSTRGLFRAPEFRSKYRPVFVRKENDKAVLGIKGWASVELVKRLKQAGRDVQVLQAGN